MLSPKLADVEPATDRYRRSSRLRSVINVNVLIVKPLLEPMLCQVSDSEDGKQNEDQTEERIRPKRKADDEGEELRRLVDKYY